MMKNELFPPQYDQIVDCLRLSSAYLVGGAVRDLLLKRPIHDLDFALPEGTIPAAKRVADQLGGAFFVLDPQRQTCRVILKDGRGQRTLVDFTLFQGETIEQDLASRDFTITSMALDIKEDLPIIDPFNGAQDLVDRLIRPTSEHSLEDDPLRCLRAVRLAAQLGFKLIPEAKDQIRRFKGKLVEISPERIRDEFFRILEGPNQSAALLSLQVLGLYCFILPGGVSQHLGRTLKNLEGIWSLFNQDHDQEKSASWSRGTLVHRLGRYRKEVREYGCQEIVPGRSIYQLNFLLPLLADLPAEEGPMTSQMISAQIPLSNQEANFLEMGIRAGLSWSDVEGDCQPVEVYRYFDRFGRAGVAAIFLALAAAIGKQNEGMGQDPWNLQLDHARYFLEGFWEKNQEWVNPPVLLDGNDLQKEFQLPPGPEIGSLLESLREQQVRTGLRSRSEGLEFLKQEISRSGRKVQ